MQLSKKKIISLPNKNIDNILNFLPFLPLTKGELQKVRFDTNGFFIKGFALSQNEFNQLEKFFSHDVNIAQYKLTAFNPTTKKIFFEFKIKFKRD